MDMGSYIVGNYIAYVFYIKKFESVVPVVSLCRTLIFIGFIQKKIVS